MSVAYRGVDPAPDPHEADWNDVDKYMDGLEKNTPKWAHVQYDHDQGDDGALVDVTIRLNGVSLADFGDELECRWHAVYQAALEPKQ